MTTAAAAAGPGRLHRFRRALAELHCRLRTEGASPGQTAAAVGGGVAIGLIPAYGAHLALCVVYARVFGLSRVKTYLAAHVNNPLTAPAIVLLEYGVGHWVVSGRWPRLARSQFDGMTFWTAGRDLVVGSLVVALVGGLVAALVAGWIARRTRHADAWSRLVEATAAPYLQSNVFHWEFVRGKLRHDPVYRALATSDVLPEEGDLLDLGCGRGIVPALVATATDAGEFAGTRVSAPTDERGDGAGRATGGHGQAGVTGVVRPGLRVSGVEARAGHVEVARRALGDRYPIELADLRAFEPPSSDAILLFDVLHYLADDDQVALLLRVASALRPGGVLLVREADADRGWRFLATRIGERLAAIARFEPRTRFRYRGAAEWSALLEDAGLTPRVAPMWGGTPHGNVLIEARR